MNLPFRYDYSFEYARVETLSPLVRRVVARNPGPFTFHGTATFIVGHGAVAVIDPGPNDPAHIDALMGGLRNETVSHIFVTHTHPDHSPASRTLATLTGAQIVGCAPHGRLGRGQPSSGDFSFQADIELSEGDILRGDDWTLRTVHTPGHTSNHLCFELPEEQTLFSGDHVMGWSTTVIVPPDGHIGDYLHSLKKLLNRDDRCYRPTHGAQIDQPQRLVRALLRHRELRISQLEKRLIDGPETIETMLTGLYPGLDERLKPAAARSMLASLIFLWEGQRVQCDTAVPELHSQFWLTEVQ